MEDMFITPIQPWDRIGAVGSVGSVKGSASAASASKSLKGHPLYNFQAYNKRELQNEMIRR